MLSRLLKILINSSTGFFWRHALFSSFLQWFNSLSHNVRKIVFQNIEICSCSSWFLSLKIPSCWVDCGLFSYACGFQKFWNFDMHFFFFFFPEQNLNSSKHIAFLHSFTRNGERWKQNSISYGSLLYYHGRWPMCPFSFLSISAIRTFLWLRHFLLSGISRFFWEFFVSL